MYLWKAKVSLKMGSGILYKITIVELQLKVRLKSTIISTIKMASYTIAAKF